MRISDWSSDVCSSDLGTTRTAGRHLIRIHQEPEVPITQEDLNMAIDSLLFIDGELRAAEGGKTYDNIGPWTGEVIGQAANASAKDVDAAIAAARRAFDETDWRSEEHTSELQSLMRISYAVFCLKKKNITAQ